MYPKNRFEWILETIDCTMRLKQYVLGRKLIWRFGNKENVSPIENTKGMEVILNVNVKRNFLEYFSQ